MAGRYIGKDVMLKSLLSNTDAYNNNQCKLLSRMEMTLHPVHSMLHVPFKMLTWLRATLVSTTR